MNFAKKISFFALAALLFVSCKDTSKDGNIETPGDDEMVTDTTMTKETAANLETTSFTIDGMTCPMGCAATIEKKLAGMDGVADAKVDYDNKTATISFDAAKQTPEKFVETVENIADGAYKVSDVKSSGDKAYYSVADQEQEKDKKKKEKGAKKCCADGKKGEGKSCHADKKATDKTKAGKL